MLQRVLRFRQRAHPYGQEGSFADGFRGMASMVIIKIMALGIFSRRANTVLSVIRAESVFSFARSEFVAFDQENGGVPGILFVLIVSGMYRILANEDIRHWPIKVLNETL